MSAAPRLLPMDAAHVPAVMQVELAAYEFPWTEGNFRDSLIAGYSSWVLMHGEQVLGYALMCMVAGEAQILNVCVAPSQRRRGLARVLMDHLLRIARAAAMEIVILEVRPSNLAALALYQSYGFAQIGVRRRYYRSADGRGEDAQVLSLTL